MTNRYAVIDAGKVENIILAEAGFTIPGKTLIQSDTAAIGDLWDGATFTAPPASPAPVPQSVTRAQGRIWLHRAGLLPAVTAAINESSDVELQIWWQDAQTWRRNNVHIETLGAAFSIDLDAAFRAAVLIEA